jgi:hypothetical protein
MWKSVPFNDSLAANIADEMDRLSGDDRAQVVSYLTEDRNAILLNPAAYSAFSHIVGDHEGLEEIAEPSSEELTGLPSLFSTRFKVS